MSRFQDFYNQQRGWNGSSNEQNRKHLFNNVRKERRTRTFDLFRGDIGAAYEQEELQPIPKITLRDTISKLLRVNKKKASKKVNRPFVVGTVKHKIHSPPFLHGPLKTKSPKKKKIPPLHIKSFAPSNYKFKPPKGLKINLLTPMGEVKTITSPFLLNTVWNKVDNKTSRRNAMHENITVRPRDRRPTRLNSSPNSIFETGTMSEEIENSACPDAKKELWPEDEDDEPVFGRLNMHKKRLERESLSKGNEKEDELSDVNQSVHPDSSFRCIEEKSQNPMMESLSHSPNFASTTQNTAENPDADTFKTPIQNVFEQTISAKKITVMDYRVSQISPPKSIFSNTISNFDVSRMLTCIDNTIPEEEHLPFSTPIAKAVFEVTPKQVQNAIVEAVTLHKSVEEWVSPHCSLPISSVLSKDTNDNNLPSSDKKESLPKDTTICNNIETTTSITESCNKVPIEKESEEEGSLDHQNAETESIDSAISPVEKSAINQDDFRVDYNSPLISPIEKDETLSAVAEENKQKALNSTYTKFSVLIEEDEGETESLDEAESGLKSSENVNDFQAPFIEKSNRSSNNTSTTNILNQNNLNEDDDSSSSSSSPSSPEVTVKLAPTINVEYDHSEKLSDNQSQEQEGEAVVDVSDFTASKSPIITETQPAEVNSQKSEANNNTGTFKVSCGKPKCNKLCCYTGINTPPQTEEENVLVAKAQYSLDATESAKIVFNQTQKEIHTPQNVSSTLETEFKVKVSSPIGLEKTLLRVAKSNEDTSAGTATPRSSTRHIPVINLTDSPVEPVKETTRKSDIRRTTLDCKSPILQSFQKRNPLLSSLDGSIVVDLISDDEDDYTCFVDRVLKKYGVTSKSPQQSPRIRTPLASIGNIPRLSSSMCRTPQSPLVNSPAKKNLILPAKFTPNMNNSQASSRESSANKDVPSVVNSPAKTPVSPMPSLPMVHVSPPPKSLQTVKDVTPAKITLETPVEKVLNDTPRKTPRRRKALKEIAIETEEVASPLRVMSLRTRNISVSPSPKKVTPRKTPSRRKAAKELLTEINDNVNLLSVMKLNEIDINACSSPKEIIPQIETSSCKTPLRRNLAKEAVLEEASEDTGHLRVMSLRSRNVSVSPSPKKMASRRNKNDNQRV